MMIRQSILGLMLSGAIAVSALAQAPVTPAGAGTEADPYQISQLGHLVWMGDNVGSSNGKYYTMQNDIDATTTTSWNGGEGLTPIGNQSVNFMGVFDGNDREISNLVVNHPDSGKVGLFGDVGNVGVVKRLTLAGGWMTGTNGVGSIVGNNNGLISGCAASSVVTAWGAVGALAGDNGGVIERCYATGKVTGLGYGLAGGIAGHNLGVISNSYATGAVDGTPGGDYVGGIAGKNLGTIHKCYATGALSGGNSPGGLVGFNTNGTVTSSYWDTQTTGQTTSDGGGTGKLTAQMKQQATFVGWDFSGVWSITENVTYPLFHVAWDAGFLNLGGGWRRLSWFGDYVPMDGAGWIWHHKHGFLYVPASSTPQNAWMYAQDMGWLYTGNAFYPFLYRASPSAWLWYNGAANPRWFLNMDTMTWERRP